MKRDFVDEFEDKLRAIEKQLKEAGASICSSKVELLAGMP